MNYDETDIINTIYEYYLESKYDWKNELKSVINEMVVYNDEDNIMEIIHFYGGIFAICQLYERQYKNTDLFIDMELNYYQTLAFIALYNSISEKILEKIVLENFELSL